MENSPHALAPQTPNVPALVVTGKDGGELLRVDNVGVWYKGEYCRDAGEAQRAVVRAFTVIA